MLSVRLACIKHAASVHPEPGSNSPQKNSTHPKMCLRSSFFLSGTTRLCLTFVSYHSSVVKVLLIERAGFYHPPSSLSRFSETALRPSFKATFRDEKPMSITCLTSVLTTVIFIQVGSLTQEVSSNFSDLPGWARSSLHAAG